MHVAVVHVGMSEALVVCPPAVHDEDADEGMEEDACSGGDEVPMD